MAVTLEDLLNKNTTEDRVSTDCPSYNDFRAARNASRSDMRPQPTRDAMTAGVQNGYNVAAQQQYAQPQYDNRQTYAQPQFQQQYDVAPTPMARPDFSRRDYNSYGGNMSNYNILDNNSRLTSQNAIPEQGQAYYDPSVQTMPRPATQYDYTVADAANATTNANADDLYSRLSQTGNAVAYDAASDNEYYSAAQRTREEQQRQQRKLNTKGKIIIGLYAAVVAVVVALIIANAAKINKGEAVTPTSDIQIVQEDATL